MNGDEEMGLRELDPERRQPGYWALFRARTVARAVPELERRRARQPVTVSSVVTSWSRTVVPLAAAAAGAALLILLEAAGDETPVASAGAREAAVEFILDGGPIPPLPESDELPITLTAAVEDF